MRRRSFSCAVVALAAMLVCALVPLPALAQGQAPMPISAAQGRTLVGTSGCAHDIYAFTVPGNTAAPVVTVTFDPSYAGDGKQAGVQMFLNGTMVGLPTLVGGVPGTVQVTMPQNPSGFAVAQVFAYGVPVPTHFTITTQNVPAQAPNGPISASQDGSSIDKAIPINGSQSGVLPPNTAGSFKYFSFPSPGAVPPTTVAMTFSPADNTTAGGVGFAVFDQYQNSIANVTSKTTANQPTDTINYDLSRNPGEPLTLQVFNCAPGVKMTYSIFISGILPPFATAQPSPSPSGPPAASGGAPAFQPFWVENFKRTPLWSGPDASARSFGVQPQFSSFLVVARQTSSRLYVYNPKTRNYAYIDASAVGPSGPPKG